jgi:hypothetical protein
VSVCPRTDVTRLHVGSLAPEAVGARHVTTRVVARPVELVCEAAVVASKSDSAEQLIAAALEVRQADDDVQPWDYGWCVAEYRRSPDARLTARSGTARMEPDGVQHLEAAMEALLKDQEVRKRWEPEELWGIVASLVVFLWEQEGTATDAQQRVTRLRRARPSLVLVPVANVAWSGAPERIGNSVMGDWDDESFVSAVANLVGDERREAVASYQQKQSHRRPMVGFATIVAGQRSLALRDAEMRLEQFCDAALLLVQDKDAHRLWSLRGAWNRPGIRGLSMDRSVIEAAFASTGDATELASQPLTIDELGVSSAVHWYSADPVPLSKLLADEELRGALELVLGEEPGVAARIRLAARWFAEAFWTTGQDDAALALGVALDALIGSRSGLPGRVMRERFALLDSNPGTRAERASRYDEIFSVRSAVAHGGTSKRLQESGFVKGIQAEVTWAAWRLLAAEAEFGAELAVDLDELFERLRWGVLHWPTESTQQGDSA